MRVILTSGFLAASLLLGCGVAWAAAEDVARGCLGEPKGARATLEHCTRVIESPEAGEDLRAAAFYNRGLQHRADGALDLAIADFTQALRLRPSFQSAVAARGSAFYRRGNLKKALSDYDEAVRLDPMDAKVYHNRALALRAAGHLERAIEDYTRAIELNPSAIESLQGRGVAWQALGRHDRAMANFEAGLRLDPRSAVLLNNRGVSWRALGDPDRALMDFAKAIEINPAYAVAWVNRGATWRSLRKHDRAREDIDKAIELEPQRSIAYFNRALLEFSTFRFREAAQDFERAANLNGGDYATLWLYLASERAGIRPRANLDRVARDAWPGQIAAYLSGRGTADSLLRAADRPGAESAQERRCEAHFFIGEKALLDRDITYAARSLRGAIGLCPKDFAEYDQAVVDLARLDRGSLPAAAEDRVVPQTPTTKETQR